MTKTSSNSNNSNRSEMDALMLGVEIPQDFSIKNNAVYVRLENKKGEVTDSLIATTPLVVAAYERDRQGKGWRTLIRWINLDGVLQEDGFDSSILTSPLIIAELQKRGCKFAYGSEKIISQYLSQFNPAKRYWRVTKLGWITAGEGEFAFVLPKEIIGKKQHEDICYRPEQYGLMGEVMEPRGSFEDWQKGVAAPTKGNPMLIFCLIAAFAGPLLRHLGGETGGFHFHGRSSQGKTTAMQVAASVWGNGAAPTSTSSATFIKTWRTTSNALEGIAAAHNDLILILDELGQCDVFDFQKVVYDLSAGQGKSRMMKDSSLAANRTWRTMYLSTGEISAREKMEIANKKAKAGQLLRLIDISTDDGIIHDPHDMESCEYADRLKLNCAEHYGWAGPIFVRQIIEREDSARVLVSIFDAYNDFKQELLSPNLEAEQARAMNRFAMVLTAGIVAVDLEIIPLTHEDIREAVFKVRDIWLNATKLLSDSARAVLDVRDFIDKNDIRFEPMLGSNDFFDHSKVNQAGYTLKHNGEPLYLFTDAAFREACNGVSPARVCAELKALNFLHQNNPGKNKSRFQIKGGEKRPFYAVKKTILSYDPEGNADH